MGKATLVAGDAGYVPSSDAKTSVITREETTTTYTGPFVILAGQPVTLSGRLLEDGLVPIAGRVLTLALGTQSCAGTTDGGGSASCTITSVAGALGPQPGYAPSPMSAGTGVIVASYCR